jgi:uncharacterized protein (DUF433 family)
MDWNKYIVSDKKILLGKPTIKGTRISVDHIISLFAQGWTEEQILKNYPRITKEALKAVFSYIHECIRDGLLIGDTKKSA